LLYFFLLFMSNVVTATVPIAAANAEAYRITPVGRVAEESGGGDSEGAGVDVPGELPGKGLGPPIPPASAIALISPVSAHSRTWMDAIPGG
jgi:hypothetical protein